MEVRVRGEAAPTPRTRKEMWLLALLALRSGAPIERRRLAGLLWPDSTDELALYNLRRSLWNLRSLLGTEAHRLVSPTSQTVALNLTDCSVDVLLFDSAVGGGSTSGMERAISLYRAPLLEECSEDWALSEREPRALKALEALEALGDYSLNRSDFATSERLWRRALSLDPLRESALRGLLKTLQLNGDYASATHAYREFRYLLMSELNVEPSPQTAELYRSLRQSPHKTSMFEVRQSLPKRSNEGNLPVNPLPIIGRVVEAAAIRRSLLSHRIVTLTGPGGVGKTRLALSIAEEMQPLLPQGAWFVDLSDLSDGSHVRSFVAQHLKIQTVSQEDAWETLLTSLETASSLLVLDNCEHLADECAAAAKELAARCASVYLLATSRHMLDIDGSSVIPVRPLPIPKSHLVSHRQGLTSLADELMQAESVQLFVSRARQTVPDFTLADDNAAAVGQICERLDGMPLAIELVAARVRGMAVQEIASRLDNIIDRLSNRGAARRQESLRGVMDWSWDLLDHREQALLRRISVFVGGCSLEAAEAVCAGGEVDIGEVSDLLLQLIDRSLVRLDEVEGEGRYTMLETVRRYAQARLAESGELATVKSRHGEYFLCLAGQAQRSLSGPRESYWLGRLDREYDNIRAALDGAADGTLLQQLAGSMWRYWYFRGYLAEGSRILERAIQAEGGTPSSRSTALLGAAVMLWKFGDYAGADARFEEALGLFRELGDRTGIAMALNTQGLAMVERGQTDEARSQFEASLEIYRELEIGAGIGFTLENLGVAAIGSGALDQAEELLQESLRHFHAAQCEQLSGTVLRHLAQIAVTRRDFEVASRLLEESVKIHERFGHRENLALAALRLGAVKVALNRPNAGRLDLKVGLARVLETGSRRGIATALTAFAHLTACEEDWRRAATLFGAAEVLRQELKFPLANSWVEEHERRLSQVREALAPSDYEAALAEGRRLSDKQAIELAFQKMYGEQSNHEPDQSSP